MMQTEILLAAYNGAAFLREQIESILHQTYTSWHLTMSDDGSTDETVEIMDYYANRYPEKINRIISGMHFGNPRDHFLFLLSQTDAPRIALCDQDDVWFPDKLKKMNDMMDTVSDDVPCLVFSDLTVTDENLSVINSSVFNMEMRNVNDLRWQTLLVRNVITGCGTLFNRALIRQSLPIECMENVIMHDWWLGIVAARFGRVLLLNESTGYYRRHGNNCVGAKDAKSFSFFVHRITHLSEKPHMIAVRKAQAEQFLSSYEEQLSPRDKAFLTGFLRSGLGSAFWKANKQYIHSVPLFAFLKR